ncbi:MAG: btuB 16 [Firmicutes bacterium]|nr:btuB 16 [Bacillota bacterium]
MKRKSAIATMIIAALVNGCTTLPALAAENNEKDTKLDEVVVTASKVQESLAESRLALPESTNIQKETLTRKDIENLHPKNLLDLIQNGLGMVTEVWGNNRYARVSTRGGDNVGIIIDGVWYPETQSSRTLTILPVDFIESITFVRDSSVLTLGPVASFATNAAKPGSPNQGFIIIRTLKATKPVDKATVGYGSYATKKYDFVHADKLGDNGYYGLGYQKTKSNGPANYNQAYDFDSYFFKAGERSTDGWATDMTVMVNNGWRQPANMFSSYGVVSSSNLGGCWNPCNSTLVTSTAEKQWNSHVTTNFSFGYSSLHATRTFKSGSYSKQDEYLRELNWWNTYTFGRDTIKVGTQFMWWHAPNGVQGGSTVGLERQEELYSGYVYDQRKVNDKLTLDGALRLDKKHITKGVGKYYNSSTNTAYDEDYGDIWEGDSKAVSLGAAYKLTNIYDLTSRVGYTSQTGGSYLYTADGSGLDPENRYKLEAGIAGHYNKKLNASLTAFHYYIQNARVANGTTTDQETGDTVYTYTEANLSRQGLELALDGALTNQLGYKLGYAFFESSNAMDNSYSPHNRYSFSLNYKNKSLSANATLLYVSKFAVLACGETETYYSSSSAVAANCGGYTTINANISKDLDEKTKITFYGHNLANRHYLYGMNYYDPGREWGIELTKTF